MSQPLLELRGVRREFPAGDATVAVLKDIDLSIHEGELVAIVGASGSGKSTLMNILGCLDRPTNGSYRIAGREVSQMSPDELAQLRREYFGFIFQRYHLLGDLSAVGNVEVPAVYAGRPKEKRQARARELLTRLGLADRLHHRPAKLSGGQQQRVSIARALANGGRVILADEPTGALDSKSGEEVMRILAELHTQGHTIVLVTHDMHIAEHADRVIEVRDGEIVSDRRKCNHPRRASAPPAQSASEQRWGALRDRMTEALRMALIAMRTHKLRTFLTMLGIIIGTASVVSVVALGNGSQQQVLNRIRTLGTNTIELYPGRGYDDRLAKKVHSLRADDAEALATLAFVDSATPQVTSNATVRLGSVSAAATINGVGEQFFQVRGYRISEGRAFDRTAVERMAPEVLIDDAARRTLFARSTVDPIGQVILIGNVPARVVGVVAPNMMMHRGGSNVQVWMPYTTVMARMLGNTQVSSIIVRVTDDVSLDAAEQAITRLLERRHGRIDFFLHNVAQMQQTIKATAQSLSLLVSSIAAIALIVGGIGVMNIMLVSVTERTKEIGVRIAVGARRTDILHQFLIEAVLVSITGGCIGVLLALGFGLVAKLVGADIQLIYSMSSIAAAFICSTLIGLTFGFLPARNAARLDPVEALSRE